MSTRKSCKNSMLFLLGAVAAIALPIIISSCGVSNQDPVPGSGKGKVALFVTDNISSYYQVVANITGVRLINSGTGLTCDVLHAPATYNVANLASISQYADLSECPAGRYNRIDVSFSKNALVMNNVKSTATSTCEFTAFRDYSSQTRPLVCSAGACTLSIPAGSRGDFLQVQEDQYNDAGVDFDLKKFMISDTNGPSCSITMAVSLANEADLNNNIRSHGVTGRITGLDTKGQTFSLVTSSISLTVDYSKYSKNRSDTDELLAFAMTEGLAVNVQAGRVDFKSGNVMAGSIFVKAAGRATNVVGTSKPTFMLTYNTGKILSAASNGSTVIHGAFGENAWLNVKVNEYDHAAKVFSASLIEVLPGGTIIDD